MIISEEVAAPKMQEEPIEKKPRKKREKKLVEPPVETAPPVEIAPPVIEEKVEAIKAVEPPPSDLDDKEQLEVISV